MREFNIGGREIDRDHPPYIIAEAGINHDGDVGRALQLAGRAKMLGADAIKFQRHIPAAEMLRRAPTEDVWQVLSKAALSLEADKKIQMACQHMGITYLSTPFSREAADDLADMDVPAFKIGSGEVSNLPLIDYIAHLGKPIILSTGMHTEEEVSEACDLIATQGVPLLLMHCVSVYPCPPRLANLGMIRELETIFQVPVGYSDHTLGTSAPIAAVALGAVAIEKHFTIDRAWSGPDNGMSATPSELDALVRGCHEAWYMTRGLGADQDEELEQRESAVRSWASASVVTIAPIQKGEEFTPENVWVKRPGTGAIPASELDNVLGRKASHAIAPDTFLSYAGDCDDRG